jgi:hypothetical protein
LAGKKERRFKMSKGYTEDIVKGISFEKFVLQCAHMDDSMDAPIFDDFKPFAYYKEKLEEALSNLAEVKSLTLEDAAIKATEEYKAEFQQYEEKLSKARELEAKYKAMLRHVEQWRPPTPDHVGLKEFMVQQITSSIGQHCDTSYLIKNAPKLLTAANWLENKINKWVRAVDYNSKELLKKEDECRKRAAWVKALRQSLVVSADI